MKLWCKDGQGGQPSLLPTAHADQQRGDDHCQQIASYPLLPKGSKALRRAPHLLQTFGQ